MPSGYRSSGIDFDDLFDPYVEGPQAQDSSRRIGGTDLSRRYAHIQYGSKRADVGHRINGMDVSNLWAARGTASYRLPFHGKDYSAGNGAKTNSFGDVTASVQISLLSDGNFTVHSNSYGGGNDATAQVDSGRWAPAGANPGQYEVQFTAGNTGAASFSTSAPSFSSLATSRLATVSISIPAASSMYESVTVEIAVHLRRSGSPAQVSTVYANVAVSGWY
ncbi:MULTISPECIES: hypothetical protein [Stenotrophomonas maltophilia group]|uniref:hypothetical protein n=1 Tax=Stenotrophomonas maltophilia group TaxID=995085 RepID=UPI0018D48DCE|nr:hypothetical protein [Stenotrophomonas maltophilia]HDS1300831.1 hypothetical protein [Stenotrophomonas maltophilia]HDS1525219.1 hypothetical protein [Stenotrophomonas maltophilia]HDS1660504.1 hypothetical protein [Stenotrophomonas maltophilia]HDS1673934.1 hypothetical protein [Stenotrophomonas maltophilia]